MAPPVRSSIPTPLPPEQRRAETLASWNRLVALSYGVVIVVIGYYAYKTDNYGGWTNGPRWLMWLTPLLLLALLPAADHLAERRWKRAIGYVLLLFSVLSVSYRDWNPWRHPWIYNFLEAQGWLGY